ncbi:MAG: glycosyltransferase [Elusimicrobia bacterium]|nr:glycosyltransferase [Elusimicrobiota bacterium]
MHKIFIGYDKNIDIAYRVLRYSLERHGRRPLDIQPLVLQEIERRHGFKRAWDPLQSTEFTYTRFLVPYLCDFKGVALFMDNDMLCFSDISEIFKLDMSDYWLRVVKHDHKPVETVKLDGKVQTSYPRKNWSSFMLINCEKMRCWSKEAVETMPARWLHRFEAVPDDKIGDIPMTWNVLDRYDDTTRLVHYTAGGPWYEQHKDHPYGAIWFKYRDEYLAQAQAQRP